VLESKQAAIHFLSASVFYYQEVKDKGYKAGTCTILRFCEYDSAKRYLISVIDLSLSLTRHEVAPAFAENIDKPLRSCQSS